MDTLRASTAIRPGSEMQLKEITLKDPIDIHLMFRAYRNHGPIGWWFRGHADKDWPLLPRAGRKEYLLPPLRNPDPDDPPRDIGRFYDWRSHAIAYASIPENDWECLAFAQHHGLATRLLDWSFNPLVATYFACFEHIEKDGCVFMYDPHEFIKSDVYPITSDCDCAGYIPRSLSPRILNQRGAFTVHGPPDRKITIRPNSVLPDEVNLVKLIIPANFKWALLQNLDDYGINRATLFPDLDGLCSHINYRTLAMKNMSKKISTTKT